MCATLVNSCRSGSNLLSLLRYCTLIVLLINTGGNIERICLPQNSTVLLPFHPESSHDEMVICSFFLMLQYQLFDRWRSHSMLLLLLFNPGCQHAIQAVFG
jgi:hypothetical protein